LKSWAHLFVGEHDLAIDLCRNIPVTSDTYLTFYGGLAYCYHKLGKVEDVLECLKDFKSDLLSGYSHWVSYNYTLIFLALGETEKMFEHLEKSLQDRITPLIFIRVDPVWREFKDDARFISLVEKTFIPEKKDRIVSVQSDTRETLEVNLRQLVFIEAQENYSRFVWLEGDEINEKILRVTLKKIDDQIADASIVRCHRSYIINMNFPYTIRGNSNGYRLTSKKFRDVIPISRSLGKEIIARLKAAC